MTNSERMIAQGYTRKKPRCNVMLLKMNYIEQNRKEVSTYVEKISGVNFKDDEKNEEQDVQDNRRITLS